MIRLLNNPQDESFKRFLLEEKIAKGSEYKKYSLTDEELDNHIKNLKNDNEAIRIIGKKINKLYRNMEILPIKNEVFEEIKQLYKDGYGLVTLETLEHMEKLIDEKDIYDISESIYDLKYNSKEVDEFYKITKDMTNDEKKERFIITVQKILNKDKYYHIRHWNINSNKTNILDNFRIKEWFFSFLCD